MPRVSMEKCTHMQKKKINLYRPHSHMYESKLCTKYSNSPFAHSDIQTVHVFACTHIHTRMHSF